MGPWDLPGPDQHLVNQLDPLGLECHYSPVDLGNLEGQLDPGEPGVPCRPCGPG